jgi:putative nucleotidyltransferase with HDIG domain
MLSRMMEAARQARSAGRWHEALASYEAAIPAAAREADSAHVTEVFRSIGDMHAERGDLELATESYGVAIAIAEANDDGPSAAAALTSTGIALLAAGRKTMAEATLGRARALAERLEQQDLQARVELGCAEMFIANGEMQRALHCCERAFDLYRGARLAAGLSETHRWYGVIYRETGLGELSAAHFGAAIEAAQACGHESLEADALREWSALHLKEARYQEALLALNGAYRIFADLHARRKLLDLDARLDTLEESYLSTVRAWAEVIEGKDRHTVGHCDRVASYVCQLARQVGIRGRELAWVQMGAYLHDVGKIAVPAEVLNRAGALSSKEWVQVQAHAVEGDGIVASLNLPWDIRAMVRSHHERWDGYGYPDGLAGEAIPLTARILCLADVYDALTTDRSFREAFPREEALRIMDGEVGRIFDPDLFLLFRAIVLGRTTRDGRRPVLTLRTATAA